MGHIYPWHRDNCVLGMGSVLPVDEGNDSRFLGAFVGHCGCSFSGLSKRVRVWFRLQVTSAGWISPGRCILVNRGADMAIEVMAARSTLGSCHRGLGGGFPDRVGIVVSAGRESMVIAVVCRHRLVADIAAYFCGKRFGKHKLAVAISPGKTIEGAVGGLVGVIVYFFLWLSLLANTYLGRQTWALDIRENLAALLAFFLLLAVLSIVGDLFESWMKRGAGMKDSSGLLPGHGGILDRIDALTSTLPLAGLYVLLQVKA